MSGTTYLCRGGITIHSLNEKTTNLPQLVVF